MYFRTFNQLIKKSPIGPPIPITMVILHVRLFNLINQLINKSQIGSRIPITMVILHIRLFNFNYAIKLEVRY